jgi:hypothetical protein
VARKKATEAAQDEPTGTSANNSEETSMTETTTATVAETKAVRLPPETVVMSDGRSVEFTGRTKMTKTILISENEIAVRVDFRNGQTAIYPIPEQHLQHAAGHGWSQKLGDHVAGMKDEATKEPATEEDMFLAIESLYNDLKTGDWNKVKSGDGTVSGASIILRALAQHFGKPVSVVKQILEDKLAADKDRKGTLSRKAMYASFRNPDTELGQLILAMEAEKKKPKDSVDLGDVLNALKQD